MKAGLATPQKSNGRLRDFFYDRVLYPIRDARRRRRSASAAGPWATGEPKYLRLSRLADLLQGARVLYGLFNGLAAVRKQRKVLLMEGYMDAIAAHQHGFVTSCAPLGTALTQEHAALIKRYAAEAVLVFDADSAGANAAIRGAEILLAAGIRVRIATVPEGKDPDEHLHNHGVQSFEKCLLDATDYLAAFKTELLLSRQAGTADSRGQIGGRQVRPWPRSSNVPTRS